MTIIANNSADDKGVLDLNREFLLDLAVNYLNSCKEGEAWKSEACVNATNVCLFVFVELCSKSSH